MNDKSSSADRFNIVVLEYRLAKLGITPRITPATVIVHLSRSLERSQETRR